MTLLEAVEEKSRTGVLEELRESPGLLEQGIVHLQGWYRLQPHLPQLQDGKSPLDEQMCQVFLRGCKHDLERTKRKIDAYYAARASVPGLFQRRDPRGERLQKVMELVEVFPLPRLTPAGYRVTVHRMAPALVKGARASGTGTGPPIDMAAMMQLMFLVGEVRMREEPDAFAGDIFVFDFTAFGAAHCAQLLSNASLVRDALVSVQAFPQRMQAIHLLNIHPAMEKILSFMKSIMKEKMRSRFHIHSTVESLHRQLPRASLPRALGGEEDRDLAGEWRRKLESYGPWTMAQDELLADESRRPLAPGDCLKQRSAAQLFGCEGSFRRLAID